MNCIFCKSVSDNSKSIEHLIPESLGNKEHVLQKGVVCDRCNNYFAIKIEKVVLDKPYFKSVRHRNFISTKKGRLVPSKVFFPDIKGGWADICIDEKGIIFESSKSEIIEQISNGNITSMVIPIIDQPEDKDSDVSRFLAKIALEYLTLKIASDEEWIAEIVSNKDLDPLRNYARYGKGIFWKYHQRRIYKEDARFIDPVNHPEPYEILHEFDLLYTEEGIMYFIIVIMGVEFAINMAEPEVDFYEKWLIANNNNSPVRRSTEYLV